MDRKKLLVVFHRPADTLGNMYILDVERKVCDLSSRLPGSADPESIRRYVPIRRNQFDNFIFEATQWAMDDGAADSFSSACRHLQSVHASNPAGISEPVSLMPPAVTERIGAVVAQWRPGEADDRQMSLPANEAELRDELYLSLGGDLGDGVAAAGRRLFSRMWSARIGDGFVHPAIGGCIWNGNLTATRDVGADPLTAAIYAVGEMTWRWQEERKHRPSIDREIMNLAHGLGWEYDVTPVRTLQV